MKFQNINVGDEVLVDCYINEGNFRRGVTVSARVSKVTKTTFTTEDGSRYTRVYGTRVGADGIAYTVGYRSFNGRVVVETPAEEIAEWRERARLVTDVTRSLLRADRLDLKPLVRNPGETIGKLKDLLPLLDSIISDMKDRG